MAFDFNLTDFERFTTDQQFVNVVHALDIYETQQGGLTPEELWKHAIALLDSLKNVARPEITVQRMFSYLIAKLKEEYSQRTSDQIKHTAYCTLFCANYILCANDEEPDPNQDIIDNISRTLVKMPDIVPLFQEIEKMENAQETKGHKVKPRNYLAKLKLETAKEAAKRILNLLETDIIQPIVSAGYVQSAYKKEFREIWKDILANEELLVLMRKEEFGKTYNLKLVLNILALMSYNRTVLSASNNKLNSILFPDSNGHPKYITTEIGNTYSAFTSNSQQAIVKTIIAKHKK